MSKYLNPKWQKRRLEVLERDNFTCRRCQSKDKTLHVHHLWYDFPKEPWKDCFLVTLCEDCHKYEELNRQGKLTWARAFFKRHMLSDDITDLIHSFDENFKKKYRVKKFKDE